MEKETCLICEAQIFELTRPSSSFFIPERHLRVQLFSIERHLWVQLFSIELTNSIYLATHVAGNVDLRRKTRALFFAHRLKHSRRPLRTASTSKA